MEYTNKMDYTEKLKKLSEKDGSDETKFLVKAYIDVPVIYNIYISSTIEAKNKKEAMKKARKLKVKDYDIDEEIEKDIFRAIEPGLRNVKKIDIEEVEEI